MRRASFPFVAPVAALVALLGGGCEDEAMTGGPARLAVDCADKRAVAAGALGGVAVKR
ncbi:MAG TPA: hypothetical protein VMT59_05305 [Gaiellaceae bacterium]|nr:hypothetical protein [Gaiellaceae bacterium]